MRIYERQGIHLPRTSRDLYRIGDSVRRDRLDLGDLVFFNTTGRGVSHVGIFAGSDRMVHAGTTRGVGYADLGSAYWRKRYIGARRIASGSTFTVAGTSVGATEGERVVAVPTYPFLDYQLLDIPTNSVSEWRSWSLQLRNNSAGEMALTSRIAFFGRLQLGMELRMGEFLGSGLPDMKTPDGLAKFRINNEWWLIPGLAIGFDTRRTRAERDGAPTGDQTATITSRRRGLFLVASRSLKSDSGPWIGRGRVHVGGRAHAISDFSRDNDFSMFAGYDQQLIRRVQVMGELDNVFGQGGWHINAAARVSVTRDAVLEYGVRYIGKKDAKVDKVLKFSYNLLF